MPFALKSTDEARAHLLEASKKVRERIQALKGSLPKSSASEPTIKLATILSDGMDDLRTQHLSTWSAITNTEHTATLAAAGVDDL